MTLLLATVLLLSATFVISYAAVTNSPGDIVVDSGQNATILWEYNNTSDMSTVTWKFMSTSGTEVTIMSQALATGTAAVQNGFSCEKNSASNGGITIINVTPARKGTYSITVVYFLEATDTDSVKVSMAGCSCMCQCCKCKKPCHGTGGGGLAVGVICVLVILVILWYVDNPEALRTHLIVVVGIINLVVFILGIVGAAAFYKKDCQECDCDCDCDCTCKDCEACLILAIVEIIVAVVGTIVSVLVICFCIKDSAGGDRSPGKNNEMIPTKEKIRNRPEQEPPTIQHNK